MVGQITLNTMVNGREISPQRMRDPFDLTSFPAVIDMHKGKTLDSLGKDISVVARMLAKSDPDIEDIIIGGAGSLAGCSLFSASYATISIIYYLLDIQHNINRRGEYLINQGKFSWINLTQDRCHVCK